MENLIPIIGMLSGTAVPIAVFIWLYYEGKGKRETVLEISKNLEDTSKVEELLKIFNKKLSLYKFKHGNVHNINNILLFDSYHCSRYNTQTKRLTKKMFDDVIFSMTEII